ncbi:putative transposase [Aurantimonas manganoxydans SI85-9A1]|uniref:Putative transposase n=1 Tax=Aurantimonas manganoxydans (strain ATCC BAA-1229 / DSM 21871 / SI85-9A1) TaxID=287752 RepID=Q1YMA9_AURMS|nr:putative transposase [Aurantimonas manganoxydans SI85-9A1]
MADKLPYDPGRLKAILIAERLVQFINQLQRHRFGRRAETLPEDQLLLGLKEVEQGVAADEAAEESAASSGRTDRAAKRRANRGPLPAHLPRIETVVDIEDKACARCRHILHVIAEDVAGRLDIVPSEFRVPSPVAHVTAADPAKGSWSRRPHRRG